MTFSSSTRAVLLASAALLGAACPAHAEDAETTVSEVRVNGVAPELIDRPSGATVLSVTEERMSRQPVFSISDVLTAVPGVSMVQGNGPRDVSISVRGSNARQTFGVRNVQVFEDGFPVTQPDGLARTDLTDPHAYGRIDVVQGPNSALFGNYATGGAIQFHMRSGRDLAGIEVGAEGGDDAYRTAWIMAGGGGRQGQYTAFFSHAAGDGFRDHTAFRTTTFNGLATYEMSPTDRLTVKAINNDTDANLSIRLSLTQFRQNPYQANCQTPAGVGCASLSLFLNGTNGAKATLTATQAGSNRNDRRTIVGLRWEHDFSSALTGRVQVVWDNRDISQPTGATAAVGVFPSFNWIADLTGAGAVRGRPTTWSAGVFFNTEDIDSSTFNVPAAGASVPGALTQLVRGTHQNMGARARGEIALSDRWSVVAGLGVERTQLQARQFAWTYPLNASPTQALIAVDRTFTNTAPEAALIWRPSEGIRLQARAAAAYGTPQVTNLFITPAGVPGENTRLDAQTMRGIDLSGEAKLGAWGAVSVTLFREAYRNELVSQSAGANLQSFTYNAPRSRHQGVEVALDLKPAPYALPGATLSAAYTHDEQTYERYEERLSAGTFSRVFDRSGKRIPGVPEDVLNVRAGYRQTSGPLAGLGGFLEWNTKSDTWMDNANLLKAPGYAIVNAGLSYDPPSGPLSRLRFTLSAQNLSDKAYVGSAGNIADSISSATGAHTTAAALQTVTGSIYAGAPRTVTVGVRARF